MILRPIPDLCEILAAGVGKAVGELHRRRRGQDAVDECLGDFIPRRGGSITVGCGRSPAGAPGGEQIELLAAVPYGQPLSPVDLLHAVEEEDTTGEVLGPVPAGARILEVAESLEAENLRNAIHKLSVHERRRHSGPRGRFILGQVPREWMLVHPEGVGGALPDLDKDFMPVFDTRIALARGDEAVEHVADFGVQGHLEPRHFKGRGRVLECLPANVIQTLEQVEADVEPDATVEVQQRLANEVRGVGSHMGPFHGLFADGFGKKGGVDKLVDMDRRPFDSVKESHRPRWTESPDPADYITLVPWRSIREAFVPESPNIPFGLRYRLECLEPGDDLGVRPVVNGGGY